MKLQLRQFQRLVFLTLLSACVLAPIFYVSSRLKYLSSSIGQEEFVEDVSTIKYRRDGLKLNAVEQEKSGDFKEPNSVIYEVNSSESRVSYSSSHKNETDKVRDNNGDTANSTDTNVSDLKLESPQMEISSASGAKIETHLHSRVNREVQSNQRLLRRKRKVPTRQQSTADEKVKEIKDQTLRAKVYLNLAPPGSNSHIVKLLKLRMKELERAAGEATKDSDLSRRAWQRSSAMEDALSKANLVYPDCSAMATKIRAMTENAEEQVKAQKKQASYLVQLAARTTPKGLHCLTMRLTAEYFALKPEERQFPNQQKLSDPSLYHYAVFSDNVLAAGVVVSSTISAAVAPEKIVFHVVTDSFNLAAISMWFLLNPPGNATIQVQSMGDFEWLSKNNIKLKNNLNDPRYTSALNHLRFYLPDIFPTLHKIVLFDHDVVIQKDLTPLWRTNMKRKVLAAVETCKEGEPSFREMPTFINFSDPFVADRFDAKACTWAFGMNLVNLHEWRKQKLTALYHQYLHLGYKHTVWKAGGSLPLGWFTFYNRTVPLDRRWHVLGLGYESGVGHAEIERAAVIHYDGVMKPWLEIGIGKYKGYWSKHVNYEHPILQQCNIHD